MFLIINRIIDQKLILPLFIKITLKFCFILVKSAAYVSSNYNYPYKKVLYTKRQEIYSTSS